MVTCIDNNFLCCVMCPVMSDMKEYYLTIPIRDGHVGKWVELVRAAHAAAPRYSSAHSMHLALDVKTLNRVHGYRG
jgi:hypothetical protein